jgi:pyruvate,orthophosphate dikinase
MGQPHYVYDFAQGSKDMRELLGGKGANVAEMTRVLGPRRVPAGFTLTTEACVAYMQAGRNEPEGMAEQVADALRRLEELSGKRLGNDADPLLVSVRSGARESMPGMLDTVLNLGLNDTSVQGLAASTDNERFAWDSYRRFVQMFGNVSRGIPGERFEDAIAEAKVERGVKQDTELQAEALKDLTATFKAIYRDHTGEDFPQDPREQLRLAIRAVFDSWVGERAVAYRRLNRIPDDWGTAVNVQQMVFGNKGETSGSGVAFSRDEITGGPEPSGDFLPNAQGEDVVSGVRTPRDIAEMRDWLPEVHVELMEILRTLEAHYKDMQDTEFTVEEGRLYMLQTRNAKRPAQAAVRFAVDAGGRGAPHAPRGHRHDRPGRARRAPAPDLRSGGGVRSAGEGRRCLAGRGQGRGGVQRRRRGAGRGGWTLGHPRPSLHRRRRRGRVSRRQGHPHVRGRQGLARRAGRPRDGTTGRGGRRGALDRSEGEAHFGERDRAR